MQGRRIQFHLDSLNREDTCFAFNQKQKLQTWTYLVAAWQYDNTIRIQIFILVTMN